MIVLLSFADNPVALQNILWLNNTLHFGLRGIQEHLQMLWGDLDLKTTADGKEYVEFTERTTKTRQGNTGGTRAFKPKMFASDIEGN